MVRAIRARRQALRQALDDVTWELAKVQGTVVAKDEAMDAFDETYRCVVRCLVQAFRMAGKFELAARIPVSPARRFRKKTDDVEAVLPTSPSTDAPPVP